jgi:ATP-dependent DNA ligase
MVDGKDLTNLGYYFRLEEVLLFPRGLYTYPTEVITQDFAEAADRIIAGGGEGIVIQRCDYTYNPGNRTAWKTLKLKQQLPEMELKVVGVLEPKKFYEGDCPETWEYELEDPTTHDKYLVTKPYYFGWKNGITVELPDRTKCDVASGLTDDDRAWLATEDAAKMIEAGELYAVVKAMSFNDKGRLRHPSLARLRNDM